jgi:ELWxxDGT repeat protein
VVRRALGLGLPVARLGGALYFLAEGAGRGVGPELWVSDGTAAGTAPVLADPAAARPLDPAYLTAFGGALYFFAGAGEPTARFALWRSDGTAAGTAPLRELSAPPGTYGLIDPMFTPVGTSLLFRADDGEHGVELWRTDGTAAGTELVADLAAGPATSRAGHLVGHNGRLFFAATEGRDGVELWTSDGSAACTRRVEDLAPGALSAAPALLTSAGGSLFFTADEGLNGRELWVLPGGDEPRPCQPGPAAVCLAGGRVRAQLVWRDDGGGWTAATARSLGDRAATFAFRPDAGPDAAVRLAPASPDGSLPLYVAGLSHREFALTVLDRETGASRRYWNVAGNLGSLFDAAGLPAEGGGEARDLALPSRRLARATGRGAGSPGSPCSPAPHRLCLAAGRFIAEATWRDARGVLRPAAGEALTAGSGVFFLPASRRPGALVKLLDGRGVNGHFWLFAATLALPELTLSVTDSETGETRIYEKPGGSTTSIGDLAAF